MCIMPKVKKCEKTFALNVDIFKISKNLKKLLTKGYSTCIITNAHCNDGEDWRNTQEAEEAPLLRV